MAGITDDPSLRSTAIEWDLWASTGPQTSVHETLTSAQGGSTEFRFDSIAVPGGSNDRQVMFSSIVTGRVRLDGDIDVATTVQRMRWERTNQAAGDGVLQGPPAVRRAGRLPQELQDETRRGRLPGLSGPGRGGAAWVRTGTRGCKMPLEASWNCCERPDERWWRSALS